MRRLGLDVGQKRIGIALSDPLLLAATPLKTINRGDHDEEILEIKGLVEENEVDKVVVGLPTSMNGSLGPQAEETIAYVKKLEDKLKVPVITWDERFTTSMATRLLIEADVGRKKRRGLVDRVAAVFILQSYLDSIRDREAFCEETE
ncbi:MAG: Holliday junction resolvase RuvX [Actinomycetota bacterium]|nr:Holliday junction resolvase RuvX [Actinomycetota bacterium]